MASMANSSGSENGFGLDGQSLFAVPSKGIPQARNIGFYFTAMFINTVNITNIGY